MMTTLLMLRMMMLGVATTGYAYSSGARFSSRRGLRPTTSWALPADESAPTDDWRAFRAQLIAEGVKTTEDDKEQATSDDNATETTSMRGPSSKNVELCEQTQPSLAAELNSSWAHELAQPEVGGLLVRMPLEVELVLGSTSVWGVKLHQAAKAEGYDMDDTSSLSKTLLYRFAQRFIRKQMQRIIDKASPGTKEGQLVIDPAQLSDAEKQLIEMHSKAIGEWQEVVLVTDVSSDSCTGVVLNRPVAKQAGAELSAALVAALGTSSPSDNSSHVVTTEAFQASFAPNFAAYFGISPQGGAVSLSDCTLIHGVGGLEGASEIASGTGIYRGGSAHAARNVIGEVNDPLDFRFFIGKHTWPKADLNTMIRHGKYLPVACSRAIALKQCLGLPKPLWHEVMEMLGGQWDELSASELIKRTDLEKSK